MEKKTKTLVDAAKFEELIIASGLEAEAQAAFVKVRGATGRAVYVARSKRVGRVTLSGFTVEHEGVHDLGELSYGSVSQELTFAGRTEEQVLSAFADVLETLVSLPAAEPRKRSSSAKDDGTIGWTKILHTPKAKEAGEEARAE